MYDSEDEISEDEISSEQLSDAEEVSKKLVSKKEAKSKSRDNIEDLDEDQAAIDSIFKRKNQKITNSESNKKKIAQDDDD